MRELDSQFESLGLSVRFVVIGDTEKISRFCGAAGMADRCIADPGKASYAQMGFGRYNLFKLFSDKALIARRKENKAAGFSQDWGATRLKDASDLPGAALIDASGALRWVHRASHPGDLPTMTQMLATAAAVLGLPAKE